MVMAVRITIRGVPEGVRNWLARRTARQRQSMQEFLRGERERIAARPSVEEWLQRVRERKEAVGSRVSLRAILQVRDAERRRRSVQSARGRKRRSPGNDAAGPEFVLKEKAI